MFACNFILSSESRLWECRVFTVFADTQVRFGCIFTGFVDNRLWECRTVWFRINECDEDVNMFRCSLLFAALLF